MKKACTWNLANEEAFRFKLTSSLPLLRDGKTALNRRGREDAEKKEEKKSSNRNFFYFPFFLSVFGVLGGKKPLALKSSRNVW